MAHQSREALRPRRIPKPQREWPTLALWSPPALAILLMVVLGCKPKAVPNSLRLARGVEMELVRVPAGEFLMGSKEDPSAEPGEAPQHTVYLAECYMGKYEVTVAQFGAFIKATGYETSAEKGGGGWTLTGQTMWRKEAGADWQHPQGPGSDMRGKDDHPVTQVSWDDAVAFCRWASEVSGRTVRLPTEAEWEKAARGTDGLLYPWGDDDVRGDLLNYADMHRHEPWADETQDDGYERTAPVGSYPKGASPYGAVDMAGNVREWTSTLARSYRYDGDDGREDPSDRGPRVLRGGNLSSFAGSVRAAARFRYEPEVCREGIGFRVCAAPI